MSNSDTNSEAWRAECEARWVMRLAKAEREDYYRLVAQHRGAGAKDALRETVNRLWRESGQAGLFAS